MPGTNEDVWSANGTKRPFHLKGLSHFLPSGENDICREPEHECLVKSHRIYRTIQAGELLLFEAC